jgi:nucleotide-binding universal stress UspA family protein
MVNRRDDMDLDFDTILLAVGPRDEDSVERLAETVAQVALPTGATVVLTHVFTGQEFRETATMLDYPDADASMVDEILDRYDTVKRFEGLFEEVGVDWERRGIVDDVADGILSLAGEIDADRIVVSGRRRSPAGKAVFGSVSQEVLLNAPCPVTYVREGL